MSVRHVDPSLFSEGDLYGTLQNHEKKITEDVERYDGNKLLNTPVEDLVRYFEEKFRLEPLAILEDQISTDQQETKLDISQDRDAFFMYQDGTREVPATAVSFFLPFTGDPQLFRLRPNSFSLSSPRAKIQGNDLVFTFVSRDSNGESIKTAFDRQLREVKQYISSSCSNVTAFNGSIRSIAQGAIESRRQRLLRAANTQASLGFPMRRREGVPTTFSAPTIKRRIPPTPPAASGAAYRPEPVLDMENYEHILNVVQNMTLVLERSPSAFKNLDEEAIRQHFLIQLNGHYEGSATAETFNGEGKTDILVREDGKNIFIAECKFWKGPVKMMEAIDQLLSYTSWRDTKTALLLFVRDTALSTVLSKVSETLKQHSSFKRALPIEGETRFRSVFGQPKDANREVFVTTLVFNVPH